MRQHRLLQQLQQQLGSLLRSKASRVPQVWGLLSRANSLLAPRHYLSGLRQLANQKEQQQQVEQVG
jgi:hypothetical protein